jgi:transglutaminase-like putative cysteine protease
MKTPPLLLGAVLCFWGWQTGFLIPGAIMGVLLEAARQVKAPWEFSDDDFARIWNFCCLGLLGAAVYAFTANEGPADFRGLFHNLGWRGQHGAGMATARTAFSLLRWLPMIFFLFAAAQAYSSREEIPLHVTSIILRRRWKTARKLGLPVPLTRTFNIGFFFLALCLFSASVHSADDTSFFWGFCVFTAWALWPQRSRRFALPFWAAALVLVTGLSYFGQRGISQFQSYLGNLNPQWLSGMGRRRFDPIQSQTEIGQLGRIKTSPKIVIRLEAPNGVPPRRLRETTFRSFKGRTWYADLTENDFSRVVPPNETTFPLINKPTVDFVNIACYLPGGKALLPLPEGSARLEHLLAYNVWKSPLGGVLEEGPGLVVFDAHYGPGKTIDEPPDEADDADVSLPDHETNTLAQVVAQLHLQGQDLGQALQTLGRFFSTQFTYSTWRDQPRAFRRNETPLTRFLLNSRSGHCEYFATAAVLLLRSIGIPARYAVGYAVHEGSGHSFVVRQSDAHAWCLVWDEQRHAWRDFDPTPASWIALDAQRTTWLQKLSDLWTRLAFEVSKFRWGQSHLRQYLLWVLFPVMAFLLYQIVFRKRHRRRGAKGSRSNPPWPGLDSEFYELEQKLARCGVERHSSEPLSEWLRRIAGDQSLAQLDLPLQEILALHYRYRFDPYGLSSTERDHLRFQARCCLVTLEQTKPATAESSQD